MRKLLPIVFCIASVTSYGQRWADYSIDSLTFDPADTFYHSLVSIDTHYHHNIWQVGRPAKTVFTHAFSSPNVIVTDTVHPYPANDTSVFVLKLPNDGMWGVGFPFRTLSFFYQLDKDTGTIARVELSEDGGAHWLNVLDTLPPSYYWFAGIPDLQHNTTGWTQFLLYHDWPIGGPDTVLFRFTFISDSVVTGRDGWEIDNFLVNYYWEGSVREQAGDNLVTVYPNPSAGKLYVHLNKPEIAQATITIYDASGREVYRQDNVKADEYLNPGLEDGQYFVKYTCAGESSVKRIVISK